MSNSLFIQAEYNKIKLKLCLGQNTKIQEEFKNAGRKLLEETTRACLTISEQRFNKWQKAQSIKEKADKVNIIKIKNVQISIDITKKWKDKLQPG